MNIRFLPLAGLLIAGVGTPVPASAAEIIKVTIWGYFGPPTGIFYGDTYYEELQQFRLNYFVRSNDIINYLVDDYVAFPHRQIAPIHAFSGTIYENYHPYEWDYQDITNIPFTPSGGVFNGFYDDPVILSLYTYSDIYPYLEGQIYWAFFGDPNFYGSYDVRLVFPDGSWRQVEGLAIGYSVLQASAIPEPATWAMLLLGFAATGSAIRRRRVTVSYA